MCGEVAILFAAFKVNDSSPETYWAPVTFNRLLLQKFIALGQRVKEFDVEVEVYGEWKKVDQQTTIGYKRILRLETVTSSKFRINITEAKRSITLANVELYHAPKVVVEPNFKRKKSGKISLHVPDSSVEIYYSLDGSTPDETSLKYSEPFLLNQTTTVKAILLKR